MLKRQGVLAVAGLIAVFAILHLGLSPDDYSLRLLGATTLGGAAFLLMTVAVILSTRARRLENLFGGLDRMYQVHRAVGACAAFAALLHFFTVPKALPPGADLAANSLVPSAPLGILGLVLLVVGLFLALNRKISYSRWRPAHKAMGLVYLLILGHFMAAPPALLDHTSPSVLLLIAVAAIGVPALFYSIFGLGRRSARSFTIEAVNPMERATELVLKPMGKLFDFTPGQFAFIEVQAKGWNEAHPFTISSAPAESRLRFTVRDLGDWTRKVRTELRPGGTVLVHGPYGRFDSARAGTKQVWIAGGVGLTPFLSTLRAMKPGDLRKITFIYAARNESEAIFLDELKAKSAELGNVDLIPLFSDSGALARVDDLKSRLAEPLPAYDYFLCGPKPMVEGLISDLRKAGVPRTRIHTEAFAFR
ncbi:ferredoxin reductase family protein [Rhizobium esperanzae]|uniref:Putative ferric reductase n=1 Tax=Rhizobium esperanzae TaxID=1967781 RepID=A0A7W6W402_9HYPH|nr:ferric reductase-like transmembrane domain-containing protein [Rhizobium esperanzae]MBB4234585.1 putative ferric reductase [Rhizobium esperanzae]